LLIPNGRWRPDTVITDDQGNEIFVLMDQAQQMRSYEAVFGDLYGRRLCCVKRHLIKAFWQDGYYFCTYQPNYPGQRALKERDCENKRVYPFGYLEVYPLKGRCVYKLFGKDDKLRAPRMVAQNPWFGFMTVCCTPLMRSGSWTLTYRKMASRQILVHIDQWKNRVVVAPNQDLLLALCLAYVFDRSQCQPLVTVFGRDEDNEFERKEGEDDRSVVSNGEMPQYPPAQRTAGYVDAYYEDLENQQQQAYADELYDNAEEENEHSADHDNDDDPDNYHRDHYEVADEDAAPPFEEEMFTGDLLDDHESEGEPGHEGVHHEPEHQPEPTRPEIV
jgi:hypothetical protein